MRLLVRHVCILANRRLDMRGNGHGATGDAPAALIDQLDQYGSALDWLTHDRSHHIRLALLQLANLLGSKRRSKYRDADEWHKRPPFFCSALEATAPAPTLAPARRPDTERSYPNQFGCCVTAVTATAKSKAQITQT
jgi:hypothetical protein